MMARSATCSPSFGIMRRHLLDGTDCNPLLVIADEQQSRIAYLARGFTLDPRHAELQ